MSKYTFSLYFNDDEGGLRHGEGIPFHELADLLKDLSAAIGDEGNVILENISRNSYEPAWSTDSIIQHDKFISLNRSVAEKPIIDLDPKVAKYAKNLKRILSNSKTGKRLYCEAIDNSGARVIKLYKEDIKRDIEHYFATKTIDGKILLIGNATIERRAHINIDQISYPINISPIQDEQLSKHYKGSDLSLRIRQKISLISNKVLSAELISFRVKDEKRFPDSLNGLGLNSIDFIN